MCKKSLTPKTVSIFLMSCGLTSLTSFSAQAEWQWNPFRDKPSSQSEQASPKPKLFQAPLQMRSPLELFRGEKVEQATGENTRRSTSTSVSSHQPLTGQTQRKIVEVSRKYPIEQRQKFLRSFVGLNEAEATARLQKFAQKKYSQTPTQPASVSMTSVSVKPASQTDQARQPVTTKFASQATAQQSPQRKAINPWAQAAAQEQQAPPLEQASYRASSTPQKPTIQPVASSSNQSQVIPLSEIMQKTETEPAQKSTSPAKVHITQALSSKVSTAKAPAFPSPENLATIQKAQVQPQVAVSKAPVAPAKPASKSQLAIKIKPAGSSALPVIRPASTGRYVPQPQQTVTVKDTPVETEITSDPSDFKTELTRLIARAEELVADSKPGETDAEIQQHIARHVDLRLLYLLDGQRDAAIAVIPDIPDNEQLFWTRTFWGLANYVDETGKLPKSDRTTIVLEQLRHSIRTVQGDAHLKIRSAAFCSQIESFGNYTPHNLSVFLPGQEVLIYSELENFKSEQDDAGKFLTRLDSSIKVFAADEPSTEIDLVDYNPSEDLCHSQRSDFMQGFKYQLPEQIAQGAYVMQLVIEDQLSGKKAQHFLHFEVR